MTLFEVKMIICEGNSCGQVCFAGLEPVGFAKYALLHDNEFENMHNCTNDIHNRNFI